MRLKKDVVTGLFYVAAIMQLTSCDEQNVIPFEDGTYITESFQKIETSYEFGNEKIEGFYGESKVETQAPPEYVSKIMERVNRELDAVNKTGRFRSARTNAIYDGYDVGVIPSAFNDPDPGGNDCPAWAERIRFFMDCEDSRPATSSSGTWADSWSIDSNKNLWMVFCRVDGRLFERDMLIGNGAYTYALLKLGYQSLPDASLLARHFDNEDSGNTNYHDGDISPNIRNQNTTLYFHWFRTNFYPTSGGIAFPDLGFSYGVLGDDCCNVFEGGFTMASSGRTYSIDDEDSGNANWLTVDGVTPSYSTFPIIGGGNTTIHIARRR